MSIQLFKLISGEELIANVVLTTSTTFDIEDVVTIAYHPAGDGKMSAGFAPHMPYSTGKIVLHTHAVAFTAEVADEMLNEYKRIFSKIITPPGTVHVAR